MVSLLKLDFKTYGKSNRKTKRNRKSFAKGGRKQKSKIDLSSDEDLPIAIMNLTSIEERLFFTGAKTGKSEYYDLLNKAR